MLINNEINPENLKEEFITKGSIILRNFLDDNYAETLYNFFNSGMPNNWWYAVSSPGSDGYIKYIRDFEENQDEIRREKESSDNLFKSNNFTYHFYRTSGDHVQGCYCTECNFRDWLKSDEIINFLSKISGIEIKNFSTMFGSKYSQGCFLSPHHDDTLGQIGFVLQLTKDWKPQWGGILHFLDDDQKIILESEVPTFNTLTLFHIPEGKGKWHYVSHVNPGVTSNRIAYSGWYTI